MRLPQLIRFSPFSKRPCHITNFLYCNNSQQGVSVNHYTRVLPVRDKKVLWGSGCSIPPSWDPSHQRAWFEGFCCRILRSFGFLATTLSMRRCHEIPLPVIYFLRAISCSPVGPYPPSSLTMHYKGLNDGMWHVQCGLWVFSCFYQVLLILWGSFSRVWKTVGALVIFFKGRVHYFIVNDLLSLRNVSFTSPSGCSSVLLFPKGNFSWLW